MSKVLVTTAIEETWGGDKDELIFIGEWCKDYDRRDEWNKRQYTTLPYHWTDRDKFAVDHDYLQSLYERVLDALLIFLNDQHNLDKSKNFWRMIVGRWLLTYIPILWDRWECMRCALDDHDYDKIISLNIESDQCIPTDYTEFTHFMNLHLWNQEIYKKIILFRGISHHEQKKSNLSIARFKAYNDSWKKKVIICIDRLLQAFNINEKVFFSNSYFDLKSFVALSFKLKQLPLFHAEFDRILKDNVDYLTGCPVFKDRDDTLNMDVNNDFEQFVSENIICQLPLIFLEGFKKVLKDTSNIKTNAPIIFTSSSHLFHSVFQIWSAIQVHNGKKLITSAHGGAIPDKFSMFNYDEMISYKKVVWNKPYCDNHVQLSPSKLIRSKGSFKAGKRLSLIGLELLSYSYRCQSGPNSSLLMEDYQKNTKFCRLLDDKVFEQLKIRPSANNGWNTRQRYIDDFGVDKISSEKSVLDFISNSKVVVCTYPQTTFSEAMQSGVPTILLYMDKYWETESLFNDLIEHMKEVKIIFTNPYLAAKHINKIWGDPGAWWESQEVILAREHFFDLCGNVNDNWIEEWSDFFNKELQFIDDNTN
jgi:putative transferase (TIGR04331 family)